MKFIILLTCALVMLVPGSYSRTIKNNPGDAVETSRVKTLVVNANITLVLVNNSELKSTVYGENSLKQAVVFEQKGDTLFISTLKKKDYKQSGVVYISANEISRIQVNSRAHIRTVYPLQKPNIDIVVNGECKLEISNIGTVNIIETDRYLFDKKIETSEIPKEIIKS
jgi:hypothetical protein